MPKLSVILPTYNGSEKHLKAAFRSLRLQSFDDFEVWVVDDSNDTSTALLIQNECDQDDRFNYLKNEERLGLASSLNLAITKASGQYIARFDGDDECDLDRFQRQVSFLDNNPEIDVLGSSISICSEGTDGQVFKHYPSSHKDIAKAFNLTNAIAHPTVMFRALLLMERSPFYDGSFKASEDLELWLFLMNRGKKFKNLPDPLVAHRRQVFSRNKKNWDFNIKARKRHKFPKNILFRSVLLISLRVYANLPRALSSSIYKMTQTKHD